jgi:thiol peroxidase
MTTQEAPQRSGAVTFRGTPMTLVGPELVQGGPAPAFTLTGSDLAPVTLETLVDGGSRAALLIVVPSLDTPVCSLESQTFNKRLSELPAGVAAYVVSMDLPFAMTRWSGTQEEDIKLGMLSDYRVAAERDLPESISTR